MQQTRQEKTVVRRQHTAAPGTTQGTKLCLWPKQTADCCTWSNWAKHGVKHRPFGLSEGQAGGVRPTTDHAVPSHHTIPGRPGNALLQHRHCCNSAPCQQPSPGPVHAAAPPAVQHHDQPRQHKALTQSCRCNQLHSSACQSTS